MSLRINQNVVALSTYGNVNKTAGRLEKSIEKLSSGMRINRASDDAAGLAISEKMRRQIRGLNRAVLNAQDGISMVQTAEGAMNESHSILHRMRELAIQASNDTLTSNDRLEIQKEVIQLRDDLDRIARNTEFNTKKLLDGSQTALISASSASVNGIVTGNPSQAGGTILSAWPCCMPVFLRCRDRRFLRSMMAQGSWQTVILSCRALRNFTMQMVFSFSILR